MLKKNWQKIFKGLPFISFVLIVLAAFFSIVFAPEEKGQGMVQKIFYFHVSSAFAMYAGFLLSGLFAVLYVWKRKNLWDVCSHAGAAVGLLFCSMVLVTGPIWAKPIWGAWWTWDPRLTTTLLIWLVFFATILLRRFYGMDERGKIYAAILTLFGILDIPLIVFAVKLWRGIHPAVLGKKDNMPWEMKTALFVTMFAILVLFSVIYWLYVRLLLVEDKMHVLNHHLEERE